MPDAKQRAFDKADALIFRPGYGKGEKFFLETNVRLEPWPAATFVTLFRTDKRGRPLRRTAQTFAADPNGEIVITWDATGVARINVGPDNDAHE